MIGMFDSGVGGLSVPAETRRLMPEADHLYVADRARAPYGIKDLHEVRSISHEVVEWLLDHGAHTIVVACNTASAAALGSLRSEFTNTPIVGMEPAVKPAATNSTTGTVAVFATAATFQGELFDSVVSRHARNTEVIKAACPEWVELVEAGSFAGPEVEAAISGPIHDAIGKGADSLVLGCTHFSFLAEAIRAVAGDGAAVIDPAPAVAAQTRRVAGRETGQGLLRLAASGDTDEFARLARVAGIVQDGGRVLPFPA